MSLKEIATAITLIFITHKEKNGLKKRKNRDQWVKTLLKQMDQLDVYDNLLSKLLIYHAFLRNQSVFENILSIMFFIPFVYYIS